MDSPTYCNKIICHHPNSDAASPQCHTMFFILNFQNIRLLGTRPAYRNGWVPEKGPVNGPSQNLLYSYRHAVNMLLLPSLNRLHFTKATISTMFVFSNFFLFFLIHNKMWLSLIICRIIIAGLYTPRPFSGLASEIVSVI